MGVVFQVIGYGWACFGVLYLARLVSSEPSGLGFLLGLVLAMLVSIVPGLLVAGMGSRMGRPKSD